MCGICGIVHSASEKNADPSVLEAMNDAMVHRGPDDSGLWHDGPAGLAARRLSIVDIENGHQPMVSQDGRYVIAFNGEIYNAADLRAELEGIGREFRTRCDTEVALQSFEVYGDEALQRFNGMFAIGVYDRDRARLFLARDRVGIKPLYYTRHDGALIFASELGSLLRSGAVSGQMDPAALDAYFAYLYVPAPDSIFKGVQKLRPAETLVFQNGEVSTERYWRPDYHEKQAWTMKSASERYMELLSDSIRLRQISDVPLGAFLSGGIDSTSVVARMSEVGVGQVKTFTIGFPDKRADETSYAKSVAEHFGTDHTTMVLEPDIEGLLEPLTAHFGEPFADSSAVPTWLVSKLAREHVTVALSGDGGDELFAGYTWLHMNRRVAQYREMPVVLRRIINLAVRMLPSKPGLAKLARFSSDSFLSANQSFRRRHLCFDDSMRAGLYSESLREAIALHACDRFNEYMDTEMSQDDWMLYHDFNMYLPDDILTKVDRMSMAASLEARVPLLDHRIVEFAASLPFDLKLRDDASKRLVKHALKGRVPDEILRQRKRGFAIPIHRWFRAGLGEHFREYVLSSDALSRRFLDFDVVERIFDAHLQSRENYGHHLWALLMFEHWLRYVENSVGVSVGLN